MCTAVILFQNISNLLLSFLFLCQVCWFVEIIANCPPCLRFMITVIHNMILMNHSTTAVICFLITVIGIMIIVVLSVIKLIHTFIIMFWFMIW